MSIPDIRRSRSMRAEWVLVAEDAWEKRLDGHVLDVWKTRDGWRFSVTDPRESTTVSVRICKTCNEAKKFATEEVR